MSLSVTAQVDKTVPGNHDAKQRGQVSTSLNHSVGLVVPEAA